MGLKQQPKCNDNSCQFCTGKHCKILNQKPAGECKFKKQRKSSAEKDREEYYWAKRNHYCVYCHKQDAYTLSGRVSCYECTQKRKGYFKNYYLENSERINAKKKEKRNKCLQQGICIVCCSRMAETGYVTCSSCQTRRRKNYKIEAERKGVVSDEMLEYSDLCHLCRKSQKMEGKKVCKSCYERINESLKKGREIAQIKRIRNN